MCDICVCEKRYCWSTFNFLRKLNVLTIVQKLVRSFCSLILTRGIAVSICPGKFGSQSNAFMAADSVLTLFLEEPSN